MYKTTRDNNLLYGDKESTNKYYMKCKQKEIRKEIPIKKSTQKFANLRTLFSD